MRNKIDDTSKITHDMNNLDLLAQHWAVLFGRSLDMAAMLGVQGLSISRADRLDSIDDKSPEIQVALRGLDRLLAMAAKPSQRRAAEVLLYTRVVCGSEARRSGEAFLVLAQAYSMKKPQPLTEERRRALIEKGRKLYNQACSMYQKVL
jgi:hypothetical protein